MAYCTTDELSNYTGHNLAAAAATEIISMADRQVDTILAPHGLTGSTADAPKAACLHFAIAGVYTQMRIDGSVPSSENSGAVTAEIKWHTQEARRILQDYVDANTRTQSVDIVRKVNG